MPFRDHHSLWSIRLPWPSIVLMPLMIALALVTVLDAYYAAFGQLDTVFTFWVPVLGMSMVSLYAIMCFKSDLPLLTTLLFAAALHVLLMVRQPTGMVWNVDAIYALQLVSNIIRTGHLAFGAGTGITPSYSDYPLFFLSQSTISVVTGWSAVTVVKYSMSILNLLTLVTFYVLVRRLFNEDYRSANLMAWLFALSPTFQGFDSYAAAESFAIIFYPLVVMYMLWELKPSRGVTFRIEYTLLTFFFLITITLSHHFTSYLVVLTTMLPMIVLYFMRVRMPRSWTNMILAMLLSLAWATLMAPTLFLQHSGTLTSSLENIFTTAGQTFQAGGISPSVSLAIDYYPSTFALHLSQASNVLLVLLALFGLVICRHQRESLFKFMAVLLIIMLSLTFLSVYVIHWGNNPESTIRTRIVEFSYFPIAFFAGLAISKSLGKINKSMLRASLLILLLLWIGVAFPLTTVFQAFPRYVYDSSYSPSNISGLPVAAEEQYSMSIWIHSHHQNYGDTIFLGTSSASNYVIGYGLFNGPWRDQLDPWRTNAAPQDQVFYVLNKLQLTQPDSLGRTVSAADLQYLNSHFSVSYSDGTMTLYSNPPYSNQ